VDASQLLTHTHISTFLTRTIMPVLLALALFGCKKLTNPYDILNPKGEWEEKSSFPGGGRNSAILFVIDDKAYMGLGDSEDTSKQVNDLWEYNVANDLWTQKADFPGEGRSGASAFSVGGKGYVTLGLGDGGVSFDKKDLWEYNPSTDTWVQKKDFPGKLRYASSAFVIDDKAYMCLGEDSNLYDMKEVWEYTPALDKWTQKSNFPGKERTFASSFVINSKGYICLGKYGLKEYSDLWEYNPANDSWIQKADFPGAARFDAAAFSRKGKGYVGLGYYVFSLGQGQYGGKSPNDFWEYDAANDLWTQKADFPGDSNWRYIGFTVGDYGYVFSDSNGCWKYSRY
jgi:N-acetylneuraminic acid mutarotase